MKVKNTPDAGCAELPPPLRVNQKRLTTLLNSFMRFTVNALKAKRRSNSKKPRPSVPRKLTWKEFDELFKRQQAQIDAIYRESDEILAGRTKQ